MIIHGYILIYPVWGNLHFYEELKADSIIEVMRDFTDYVIGDNYFKIISHSYGCYIALGLLYKTSSKIKSMFLYAL